MHGLLNRNKLSEHEQEVFTKVRTWFEENLEQPDFYNEGNQIQGITWFKETSKDMIDKLQPLTEILDNHSVEYELKTETNPGKIVYEDEYQIGTI